MNDVSTLTLRQCDETLTTADIVPGSYDKILVAFSGGKDSLAGLLHLIDLGLRDRIELHHHDIDGGADDQRFMDWPVTRSYCRAVAAALGLPIYFSHKEGGFLREMLRDGTATAPTSFERPDGTWGRAGGKGPAGTRLRFPQVSADLSVRWCSAYLKIDVMDVSIRNQDRFNHARTLVVSGERAEESPSRSRYATFERHRTDARNSAKLERLVDVWRPVHGWTEAQVWAIIQRHGVVPHPAYYLGWGRLSCMKCIFGSKNQWASIAAIDPAGLAEIAGHESAFGNTIDRSKESVTDKAAAGTAYAGVSDTTMVALAMSDDYHETVLVPALLWMMPSGAFGEKAGPV